MKLPQDFSDLVKSDNRTGAVSSREGKTKEFKEDFILQDLVDYGKSLAAFANADGGVIVFGVAEKPRRLVGVPEEHIPDEVRITQHLRNHFAPEIPFTTEVYEQAGRKYYAIAVERALNRPVICRKGQSKKTVDGKGKAQDKHVTQEGAIYYRYSAETRVIGFTELSSLLQEREKDSLRQIIETFEAIEKVGPGKVAVVDAQALSREGGVSNVYISRVVAKTLRFIEEGRFVESQDEGAPAYVIAGHVNLNAVIPEAPDDEEKMLPTEFAKAIQPELERWFSLSKDISPSQVKPLMEHLGLMEYPYHHFDTKVRRRYYYKAAFDEALKRIKADPLGALSSFASRADIAEYEARLHQTEEGETVRVLSRLRKKPRARSAQPK